MSRIRANIILIQVHCSALLDYSCLLRPNSKPTKIREEKSVNCEGFQLKFGGLFVLFCFGLVLCWFFYYYYFSGYYVPVQPRKGQKMMRNRHICLLF